MKVIKVLFLMIAVVMISGVLFAQSNGDYRTATGASGNWNTIANWEVYNGSWGAAAASPTSANGVITIRSDANITYNAVVTVDQLVIDGTLTVASGISFTVADGTGDDVTVNGTLLHQGLVPSPMNGQGVLSAGSVYIHNTTAAASRMLTFFATKNPASTWIYRGSSTLNSSVSMSGQSFGNLQFESTSGTWSPSWTGTSVTTINGNFQVGTGVNLTVTSTATNVFKGNYTVNGAITYSTGTQNFSFQGSGKTIGGSGSVQFENATITATGSYTLNSPVEVLSGFTFTVAGIQSCGGNYFFGAGSFTISSGATFKMCNPLGIAGNVQVTGTKTYSTTANYEFFGSVNQVTGIGFPNTVNNLTINNPLTVSLSGNINVSGSLNFLQGYLDLGNFNLTGSGVLTGNPELIYSGTGIATAVGTNTDAFVRTTTPSAIPATIDNLVVEVGANNNFYLPNDVTFNTIAFTSGGLILNHNVLSPAGTDFSVHAPNNSTFLTALSVTKTNSPATYGGGNQSISRLWNITGSSSAPVEITLSWPTPGADNGIVFTDNQGKLWKYSGFWTYQGLVDIDTNVNVRSATFSYTLGAKDANNDFTIAGDEQTLPVELSSFTAVLSASSFVNLAWTSQSETGLSGYYVYRHVRNELASAERISGLIPATNTSSVAVYNFRDEEVDSNSTYYYWLEASEMSNESVFHGPISIVIGNGGDVVPPAIPGSPTQIDKVFPNPFSPGTEISYVVKDAADVNIGVYNLKGQLVRSLVNTHRANGSYNVVWDGKDSRGAACSSGIYYVIMQAGSVRSSQKMVLVK